MAFSFNWAGLNVPQIQSKDTTQQAYTDASNLGKALRGYEVREANREYADLINGRNDGLTRMAEISKRIAQLQKRNEEIRSQLSGMVQPYAANQGQPNVSSYPFSNQGV